MNTNLKLSCANYLPLFQIFHYRFSSFTSWIFCSSKLVGREENLQKKIVYTLFCVTLLFDNNHRRLNKLITCPCPTRKKAQQKKCLWIKHRIRIKFSRGNISVVYLFYIFWFPPFLISFCASYINDYVNNLSGESIHGLCCDVNFIQVNY